MGAAKRAGVPDAITEKAERAVQLARLMLGVEVAEQDIEDQSFALMYLPSYEMALMHERWIRLQRSPSRRAPSKRGAAAAVARGVRSKGR